MRRAVILSAGQGSRLGRHDRPKCLTQVGGATILDHQIQSLLAAGVSAITVVSGYGAQYVDEAIARWRADGRDVETLFNPFFAVADNIVSVWMARNALLSGSLLINGDTLFGPDIVGRLLATQKQPVAICVDTKPSYDDDDMKVVVEGDRVRAVGKLLDRSTVNGEAIGVIALAPEGGALLMEQIDALLRDPQSLRAYYLAAVSELARKGHVSPVSIEGLAWCEIDFPADLLIAEDLIAKKSLNL